MDPNSITIGVATLGKIPSTVPKVIAAHISGYYDLTAWVLVPRKQPAYAFDERRLQYNAGIILDTLNAVSFKGCKKVLGVLNVDIFIPIFKHVFGEARQGGRIAIISLYRLGQHQNGSAVSRSDLYSRAAKVALHELGHLFNLHHCDNGNCLMHFSGALDELDTLSFTLCRYCKAYLQDALKTLASKPAGN